MSDELLREARALMAQARLDIPLTAAMQVDAKSWDGQELVLRVPIGANKNDKGTAFAGSIAGLANLTGWAALTLWAEERFGPCQAAVYHSDLFYRKPIYSDFTAIVKLPDAETMAQLEADIEEKGRGKIAVEISLIGDDGEAAIMKGKYAVWPAPDESDK